MKKLYLEGTKTIKLEGGHTAELNYYLLETVKKGNKDSTLYGIQIEKKDGGDLEVESSGVISYSKEIVRQMIHKLMEHTVTPIVMLDIVEDMITEELCS